MCIDKYNIDLRDCIKKEFDSFNDFFTRKKNIRLSINKNTIISPCDSYLSIYQIDENLQLQIKHSTYTVAGLLKNDILAERFRGGICCIFRLEPHHYHRYLYAVSGTIQKHEKISGVLHCVRPIACEKFPVYVQNSREYMLIEHQQSGSIVQMEVGALLIGKIHNYCSDSQVECGIEKGYFEYGGSTIILLFQKDMVQIFPKFNHFLDTGREMPIKIGQALGKIRFY